MGCIRKTIINKIGSLEAMLLVRNSNRQPQGYRQELLSLLKSAQTMAKDGLIPKKILTTFSKCTLVLCSSCIQASGDVMKGGYVCQHQ